MKTEKDITNACREQLCAFLNVGDDGTTNEEALRSDAYDLLQELIDTDQISFTFDELDDDAKWKVCAYNEPEYEWWLDEYAFFKEDAKEHGFDIDDIDDLGSGGSAAWCGSVDLPRFLAHYMTDPADIFKLEVLTALIGDGVLYSRTNVTRGYSYNSPSMAVDAFDLSSVVDDEGLSIETACTLQGADVNDLFKAVGGYPYFEYIDKWVEEKALEYADEIYTSLSNQYEYFTSEECARESAEANDWVFNAKGQIIDRPVPIPAEKTSAQQPPRSNPCSQPKESNYDIKLFYPAQRTQLCQCAQALPQYT